MKRMLSLRFAFGLTIWAAFVVCVGCLSVPSPDTWRDAGSAGVCGRGPDLTDSEYAVWVLAAALATVALAFLANGWLAVGLWILGFLVFWVSAWWIGPSFGFWRVRKRHTGRSLVRRLLRWRELRCRRDNGSANSACSRWYYLLRLESKGRRWWRASAWTCCSDASLERSGRGARRVRSGGMGRLEGQRHLRVRVRAALAHVLIGWPSL